MRRKKACGDNITYEYSYKISCHVIINTAQRSLYAPPVHFYVLPTDCVYVFFFMDFRTAIISVIGIILLFIIQGQCVYRAVRT